jgi:hypothetical protein
MTSEVQWSDALPLYENTTGEAESFGLSHSLQIQVDAPAGRYVYRVGGHDGENNLIRSGDFWIGLDP